MKGTRIKSVVVLRGKGRTILCAGKDARKWGARTTEQKDCGEGWENGEVGSRKEKGYGLSLLVSKKR